MNIIQILSSRFAADVRGRGSPYFYSGAVRIVEGTPSGLAATVRGSGLYNVSMALDGHELHMSCSCPYFTDRGVGCKHLWAAVLMAQRHGHLEDLYRTPNVSVRFVDEESHAGDFDDDDLDDNWGGPSTRQTSAAPPRKRKTPPANWTSVLGQIKNQLQVGQKSSRDTWPANRQLLYVIDGPASQTSATVSLELAFQDRKKDGTWAKPKFHDISAQQADAIPDETDAPILAFLYGAEKNSPYGYGYYNPYRGGTTRFALSESRCRTLLPLIGKTGRLFVRLGPVKDQILPVRWDEGAPWQLRLRIALDERGKSYHVTGWLHRDGESQPVTQPSYIVPAGVAMWHDSAGLLDHGGAPAWLSALRKNQALQIPANKIDAFLAEFLLLPNLPPIDLPEQLKIIEERLTPTPHIVIRPRDEGKNWRRDDNLSADVTFDYADQRVPCTNTERGIYDAAARRLIVRDLAVEQAARAFLSQHGFYPPRYYDDKSCDFVLPTKLLPKATRALLEAGWRVEAEGKLYRTSGAIKIDVATGIDWFDLEGNAQFDDQVVPLPRLLQALKRGEKTIQLDDGTFGMLPEEWLKKYGMLAGLGTIEGDQLRFSRQQAGLLDALLASMPDVSLDKAFRQAADELRRFEGIAALEPPAEFVGTLREYQREGLGWLHFLERFGFGGCLADDMGLGKTVQVLALLADRAQRKKKGAKKLPALIVVPRSLVFNWQQEAARFAPNLTVLDHTGPERDKSGARLNEFDVVVTTYGTLRRDVLLFKDAKFDYCILDEAQTVKNAGTDQAKAVRLLRANHRLALSGTPIENHLGELWSFFEFLNPGMLGHASIFKLAGGAARNPEPETRAILAKGLRPFILRRTKGQVAKDLPAKTEQTLYCELEADQRKLYDELRDHYRQSLLKTIESVGMNRAKIQVLEALLRLRQAACHPGLIDKKKCADSSAKLDMLLPQLQEAHEEGQKTLVFSQFTSFLSILRAKLDEEGLTYEYLDGKTRNRQQKVEHFQNDPECKLFLISLKAGGVGLNLTAAEYVFLLDPWWNPAVEAQAIDRTHRIGQTKPVFAYRLIAKNTVEEKVLELQKTKRDLADAILNADNSVISTLKREDLEMLLS